MYNIDLFIRKFDIIYSLFQCRVILDSDINSVLWNPGITNVKNTIIIISVFHIVLGFYTVESPSSGHHRDNCKY